MALKDVVIARKQPQEDALTKVAKGLNIAQSVIGSVGGVQDILGKLEAQKQAQLTKSEEQRRFKEGIVSPKEQFEAASKGATFEEVSQMVPGAFKDEATGKFYKVNYQKPESEIDKLVKGLNVKQTMRELEKPVLTPGQEAQDKKFGADMVDWENTGKNEVAGHLSSLSSVISTLEKSKGEIIPPTGKVAGLVRKVGLEKPLLPTSSGLQQEVGSIVQGSLKATLGPQFTEGEGKRILENSYDPSLPIETNVAKLKRLQTLLSANASAKQAMSDYFNANGTLKGYKGPQITTIKQQIMNEFGGKKEAPKGGPKTEPPKQEKLKDVLKEIDEL